MIKDMDSCTTNVTTKIITLLFTQADSRVILGGREEREKERLIQIDYILSFLRQEKTIILYSSFLGDLKWLLSFPFFLKKNILLLLI